MSGPRIGSLFSGYGGLDRAVEAFFGASPAWFVEFDAAPSKILAHHYPRVPNHGDVTTVDWASVEPVDIMTGGFPCQDVSLAGGRAGLKDGTRSGLWSEFARGIDALRPQLVVIENVRGLLSAAAGESQEWTDEEIGELESGAWRVGDGDGGPVLRAAGAVLGDLAGLGYDAQWCAVRASDAGAPHQRYRVFILAHDSRLGRGEGWAESARFEGRSDDLLRRAVTRPTVATLPTPNASVANDGEGIDTWMARRARVRATGINGNGMGMPLSIAVQELATLPTPVVTDSAGTRNATAGRRADSQHHAGQTLTDVMTVLPTPTTAIATGGNAVRGGERSDEQLLPGILQDALPKPDGRPSSTVAEYLALWDSLEDQSPYWLTDAGVDYWPAIERWTRVMGRKAPAPTIPDGSRGQHRLHSVFAEWLMGQPLGWITGVGLTRTAELKAAGNGVVTQQALLALSVLWPFVRIEVAA